MASHVILGTKTGEPPFYFQDVGKVCGHRFSSQFYCRTRKQSHIRKKTTRCKTFANLFRNKNELRKVEEIPALELNEYICEFIISVRTKDGKDYEPSSLRSLLASFERHLKKNSYSASIMNDLVFEKTRKVLLSKQKELKKKGKGNRPNASITLTSDELNTLYEGHWRTVTMSKNIAMIWICCYISLALKFPLFPLLKFWKENVEVFTLSSE